MRTATLTVRSLIDRIDRGEIRLPEIQRAYVWKPAAIAGLIESLYRRYPSGSLLMWEADQPVAERDVSIGMSQAQPLVKPLYLLDGQQRLTSLHRAYQAHERAVVVFNVETEKFQVESAATRRDARWVRAHTIVNSSDDIYDVVERLHERLDLPRRLMHDRLEHLRKINDYSYYIEILEELPYEEVTEIFVRVNSRGRSLKTTDLALATLSARWPGTVARFEEQVNRCDAAGYGVLDIAFHARALAALVSPTASPTAFTSVQLDALEDGWKRLERGVDHAVKLLHGRLRADTGDLLPSVNALVPLVGFLGLREDRPLDDETSDALLYWLLGAWVQARYSQSVQTTIAQDMTAVRSDDPVRRLFQNMGLVGQRLVVTEPMLVGRGATSPYFLLSYLCARRRSANDWWHGVPVSAQHVGGYKVEYHHVHPRATLKALYAKAEINDVANLAFISAKANRKISDRSPRDYFPEVGDAELTRHAIPLEVEQRDATRYPEFIAARRSLLAEAMTELLEAFRPAFLDAAAAPSSDPVAGDSVVFEAFGGPEDEDTTLVVMVTVGAAKWKDTIEVVSLRQVLADVADGRASELEVGGQLVEIPVGAEDIAIELGPLVVVGSLDEWTKVLDRELGDLRPRDELPQVEPPTPWEGARQPFPVLDSE